MTGPPGPCGCGCALTPETSLGFHVIRFADEVLGVRLHPWQQWLLVHMLELLPDNTPRFRTVLVLVARQNGKSTLSTVLALWFMYVYGLPLVLGTAQDLDTAEEVWQGAVDLVTELDDDDQPVRPDLFELFDRTDRVNGKKALVIERPPGMTGKRYRRYKVKAANRRAGRGLSGDLILLDELREHQSWDAWAAITKTTMARALALILCLSNAGDATSVVLRYLRKLAHAAVGDPDGINAADDLVSLLPSEEELDDFEVPEDEDSLAIFEWSAPPAAGKWDRDGWAAANPSMNHPNGIAERTIAAAARTDPEWVFRMEVMCQWSESSTTGPFPPGAWEAEAEPPDPSGAGGSRRDPDSDVALCVTTAWDRSTSWVTLAAWRPDGLIHVEVIASRTGTDWVVPWLTDDARSQVVREAPIAVREKGAPESTLIGLLEEAGRTVIRWGGADVPLACGQLYDRVAKAAPVAEDSPEDEEPAYDVSLVEIRHRSQVLLNQAAAHAKQKTVGDTWVWDLRHSPVDVAPLAGITGATWLLTNAMPPPTTSAYEDADLLVV